MSRLSKRAVYEARTRLKFLEMDLSRALEACELIEERWGDLNDVIVPMRYQLRIDRARIQDILDSLEAPMDGRFDYEEVVDRGSDT